VSLLTIAAQVAGATGFAVPSSVSGNTDRTATQLLSAINEAGTLLARWHWQALQIEYPFTTTASDATYALPADYGYALDYTFWDRHNLWRMFGSLTPQQWQAIKSGITTVTPRRRFRLWRNEIHLDPTPDASSEALVFEYISKHWCTNAAGSVGKLAFSADDDIARLDEYLIALDAKWRFLRTKQLAYLEEKDEADYQIELAKGRDVPGESISMGKSSPEIWPPLPAVPVTGYGS
jgi:hypothetical protein